MPEYVSERKWSANDMAWMSAREKMGHGPTQTGVAGHVLDGRGEPSEPDGVISETAPAPQDSACEILSMFCKPPKRGALLGTVMVPGEPALKRSMPGTTPECGWPKMRQIEGSSEFRKHISPCEHVYRARCVACRKWCSWNES